MSDTDSNCEASTIEFAWSVHSYLNEYIRFADTKAGVGIVWSSALLGVMIGADIQDRFLRLGVALGQMPIQLWATFTGVFAFLAFGLLAASFFCFVASVIPRLIVLKDIITRTARNKSEEADQVEPGNIFWKEVLAHGTHELYARAIRNQTAPQLTDSVFHHVFALSSVADKKYWWVNWGLILALAGSAIASFFLL